MRSIIPVLVLCGLFGCGDSPKDLSLNVTWSFVSGDCTTNGVKTVRVTWGPSGSATKTVDFLCSAGEGKLGDLAATGGSYSIVADGLDAGGVARFTHFGSSLTVGSSGTFGRPVDLTLRPKPADVIITWQMSNGGGCPPQVQLPYYLAIYEAADGGTLGTKVKETQESCASKTATLEDVAPGSYVVELDTRAVTPKVRGTKNVTLLGGENAMVDFQF